MPKSIRCARVNHLNVVLQDFDASVTHFRTLYGADFLLDLPAANWHACLIEIGRVIIEIFAPNDFFLNARHGAHYLGIEYQADLDEVREVITARGIRIVRDIGPALHTLPADTYGIALEFYSGSFHDNDWPLLGGQKMKSPAYWRDEHPLGLTGLKGYTVAVADLAGASAFFRSFLGAEVVYEAPRPAVAGRAVGLQVADAIVELVTPVGDGKLQQHLLQFGDGIRSTVFEVRDLKQAQGYFTERGVNLVPGTGPDTLVVPAEVNRGIIFEFSE